MTDKLTITQIEEELDKIDSLDYKEKAAIMDVLNNHLDFGGVTAEELRESIIDLRKEYKISETDAKYLEEIAEKLT